MNCGCTLQAFPKGSQLAIDFSTAILMLAESGELQRIHDLWLSGEGCSKSGVVVESNELGLTSFWGLFLMTGMASTLCCIVYWARMALQHRQLSHPHSEPQACAQSDSGIVNLHN
jgi:ionotropic glutamate receptor